MANLSYWFWPVLFFLLAAIWLWTLLRHRQRAPAAGKSVSGLTYRFAEAEDALKAAYALQEAGGTLDGKELARSMSLPGRWAGKFQGLLSLSVGRRRTVKARCT